MMAGVAQGDAAVLVISADAKEFDFTASSKTREHALIARAFGMNQIIVAVNKMDIASINFSEERFI